jgi:hypothetical protein
MVELLLRDIASFDRADNMFPFLRNFDVYAGHSWASGQAPFGDGGNEESTSEAINAWAGMILLGAVTGNMQMRDAGIWLYTQETNAAFYYWFNAGPVNTFPAGFTRTQITNLFDAKSDTATWFGAQPGFAHGIQFLPFTGASLYLGRNPAYCQTNFNEVLSLSGGGLPDWPDLMQMYEAFFNPADAINRWNSTTFTEDGESRAHQYAWLQSLSALGQVHTAVTANWPFYAVFRRPATGAITHVASNPTASAVTVTFSDGASLTVPAGALVSDNGGGQPVPTFPTAPTSLTAAASSSSAINLNWTASSSSGVTYSVFRGTTDGFTPSTGNRIAGGITGTTYSSTGLAASTTYFYRVTAVNSVGSSSPSNQAGARTLAAGPAFSNTLYVIDGAAPGTPGTLSATPGAGASTDSIPGAGGVNRDGVPTNPLIYRLAGITAAFDSAQSTRFTLYVDAGAHVGDAAQVRVSYDFTGDGTFDRVETYRYFATNDLAGWEGYTQAGGLLSASGSFANLANGTVRIEVWAALGTQALQLRTSARAVDGQQSAVTIPFR